MAAALPRGGRRQANLSVCSNAIAHKFQCLAVTLEQPFKDTTFNTPDAEFGWSAPRAMKLGAALVDVLHDTLPHIARHKAQKVSRP